MSYDIDMLMSRLTVLEAERAVRKTIARYMALCDVPNGAIEGETLAALFTEDAIWQGIGPQYSNKFGYLKGHHEILAMLTGYLPPTPHFAVNTHFLTSEYIAVNKRATQATGRWIMLQASGYVDGRAELISAKLEIEFVPAPDRNVWLIQHFRTQRLFDAPWPIHPSPTDIL
jgi:SnoaL-like domain